MNDSMNNSLNQTRPSLWQKLKKETKDANGVPRSLCVLAPMADVTDAAFRAVIAKYGRPDVMWTEFVSADGLVRATPEGKKKLLKDLEYSEAERPIVAQLFGSNPENMEKAAKLVAELGFDALDINMGCPDRSIEKQGAGAGMMKNVLKAKEIIIAAKKGANRVADAKFGDDAEAVKNKEIINLPVSVKTRIGYNKNELNTWLPALLETGLAMITIHARTRKEMSLVPADWEQVKRAVQIRDEVQKSLPENERTLIFGNGDVVSVEDGNLKAKKSGADGVMLGRAIFGNPWLFRGLNNSAEKLEGGNIADKYVLGKDISKENNSDELGNLSRRLDVMIEHTLLFEKLLGGVKNFAIMKKHYKAYVNGFDGAKELREQLMQAENGEEVEKVVNSWKKLHIKA